VDPAWWFSEDTLEQKFAIKACGGCAIKDDCLQEAMTRQEEYGIWGGVPAENLRPGKMCAKGHDQLTHSIIMSQVRRCGACYRNAQQAAVERRKKARRQ
jgi:hypothetical protein